MRVLHVYKSYYPDSVGGVERSIKNIIDGLKDKGIKSNLLTTHQKKKIPNQFSFKKNFQIFRTPFSLGFFLNFKSITNNFDIIHYHHPWPFMDLVHLIHNIKKISIVTYHSDIVRQKKLNFLYRPIMNKFLSKVDKIVCSSENYLKSSRVLKKFENKTLSIPFGIKKNDYKIKKKNIQYFKRRYGSNFFIFVGSLRYYKGLKYLIDAVIDTNNKLIIIGDGEMYNILQKKINLCKNKNIKILKNIGDNQLPYFIKLSKCLILPSHLRSEAFGFSLVEGLMFGKPLISCDIKTGTSFINKNNSTGFVVKPRSSLSLKLAINKINSKKFNSKKISKNCKYRFNKYFTQEKMIFKYLKLYKSLFKSHDRIN